MLLIVFIFKILPISAAYILGFIVKVKITSGFIFFIFQNSMKKSFNSEIGFIELDLKDTKSWYQFEVSKKL